MSEEVSNSSNENAEIASVKDLIDVDKIVPAKRGWGMVIREDLGMIEVCVSYRKVKNAEPSIADLIGDEWREGMSKKELLELMLPVLMTLPEQVGEAIDSYLSSLGIDAPPSSKRDQT